MSFPGRLVRKLSLPASGPSRVFLSTSLHPQRLIFAIAYFGVFMQQAEFEEHVGKNNICDSILEALDRARDVYKEMCSTLLAEPLHDDKIEEVAAHE
jgi:hypothetical protein